MAQTSSHLTQYHAVAYSLAGAAAAFGIYTIYMSYSEQTAHSNLRRSNAVHRPRREHGHQGTRPSEPITFEWANPSDTAQLGGISVRRGERPITIVFFGVTPFPTTEELRASYSDPEIIRDELQRYALEMVLTICLAYASRSQMPAIGPMVDREGFEEIMAAIVSRNAEQLLSLGPDIPRIIGAGDEFSPHSERAIRQIAEHESWAVGPPREPGSGSGSEDNVMNPTETDIDMDMANASNRDPSQGLRGLLYYIAEEDAIRKAYEHRGIRCEGCSQMPIRGIRYHCLNCPDFDLCASCEAHAVHQKTHVFAKIKIPLPVLSQPTKEYRLWYPGDPRKIHPSLDAGLRKKIIEEYELDAPLVDALYEQFTCIANVAWPSDPCGISAAIDRRAFDKSMSSERWNNRFAPNAMFDRMFAFYDTDCNGLLGFKEFVDGFAYLRGPKRFASLQRAIRGFDIDGDGFVERTDFLRLLRAKFEIQKQLIRDATEGQELEQTQLGWETIKSSQPISSIFSDETVPQSEERPLRGKLEVNGDMRPLNGTKGKTILDDDDPFPQSAYSAISGRPASPSEAHVTLRRQLLNFEDLLYGRDGGHDNMDLVDGVVQAVALPNAENSTPMSSANPAVVEEREEEAYDPYIQDVLWSIAEDGFNEILNPLFMSKELESEEINQSRADRAKWRSHIDEYVARDGSILDRLEVIEAGRSMASLAFHRPDPVRNSLAAEMDRPDPPPVFRGETMPTDWESLARLEADIPAAPLEDLLATSGYSVREENDPPAAGPRAASLGASTIWNGHLPQTATSPLRAVLSNAEAESEASALETSESASEKRDDQTPGPKTKHEPTRQLPDKQQLRMWAILDAMEKDQEASGGPARLSCGDVEKIIVAKNSQALRGVVKSWLEFASF